jgi:hypothetical protein
MYSKSILTRLYVTLTQGEIAQRTRAIESKLPMWIDEMRRFTAVTPTWPAEDVRVRGAVELHAPAQVWPACAQALGGDQRQLQPRHEFGVKCSWP